MLSSESISDADIVVAVISVVIFVNVGIFITTSLAIGNIGTVYMMAVFSFDILIVVDSVIYGSLMSRCSWS